MIFKNEHRGLGLLNSSLCVKDRICCKMVRLPDLTLLPVGSSSGSSVWRLLFHLASLDLHAISLCVS